jgi:hypothetical protein
MKNCGTVFDRSNTQKKKNSRVTPDCICCNEPLVVCTFLSLVCSVLLLRLTLLFCFVPRRGCNEGSRWIRRNAVAISFSVSIRRKRRRKDTSRIQALPLLFSVFFLSLGIFSRSSHHRTPSPPPPHCVISQQWLSVSLSCGCCFH